MDNMNINISLTFEASEMFLSFCITFTLQRAAVVWEILEMFSGLNPLLEMIDSRYFKFSTASSI